MPTFEQLWSLLYDHGATNYYKHDCCEIWNSLTPDRQKQLYDTISTKLSHGLFVHYNPLQAINANIRRQLPIAQPTNYYGRALPRGVTFYKAVYNGEVGLYSEQDVKAHKMQNAEMFVSA